MPAIMTLEGPQLSRLDEIRGQLYAAVPRSIWRASTKTEDVQAPGRRQFPQLAGWLSPFKAHSLVLIGGVFFGAWLAGSKTGQGLVAKIRKR